MTPQVHPRANRAALLALLLSAVLVAGAVPGHGAANGSEITSVTVGGPGVATTANGTVYVWRGRPVTLGAVVRLPPEASALTLCVDRRTGGSRDRLACRSRTTDTRGAAVALDLGPFPNRTSSFDLAATIRADGTTTVTAVPVRLIGPAGDLDGDGLSNGREVALGTDPTAVDTDGDGRDDAEAVRRGLDPTDPGGDDPGSDELAERVAGEPADLLAWLLVGTVVLALPMAGWWWRSTDDPSEIRVARSPPVREDSAEPAAEPASTASAASGHGSTTPTSDPDPELLPPEERVLRLVDEQGGPVRQVDIVDRTGWSKAKVSRVLSRMEEEGQITRYRIGRGNVVARPDHDPAARSDG